jgi:hypothetical protein
MSWAIPEGTYRVQTTVLVSGAEAKHGQGDILREAAKNLAAQAVQKMLDNCRMEPYPPREVLGVPTGHMIRLDVYVLSPDELHKLLAEARAAGEEDAKRWGWTP